MAQAAGDHDQIASLTGRPHLVKLTASLLQAPVFSFERPRTDQRELPECLGTG